jgi:hypothetical protein
LAWLFFFFFFYVRFDYLLIYLFSAFFGNLFEKENGRSGKVLGITKRGKRGKRRRRESSVPGDEDVGDEEVDVGDEKREEAARKTDAEEVHERQLVALLLRQTCRDDVGRRSDQRSIACVCVSCACRAVKQ